MRALGGVVFAGAMAIGAFAPAFADTPVTATVVPQAAPVVINQCLAGVADDTSGGSGVNETVAFTNTALQDAVAVVFEFDMRDAGGALVGIRFGQNTGRYGPYAFVDLQGSSATSVPGASEFTAPNMLSNIDTVACSVYQVRFADGSAWINPGRPG